MATNLPSYFSIQFLEQLLKFLANFTLLKYVKSQRSYGFLITKRADFWLQIFGFKRSLLSLLKTIVNKFAISSHTTLILGVHALRSYLKLICDHELHSLPNKTVAQRVMVKTVSRSNRTWSVIFCVIVYSKNPYIRTKKLRTFEAEISCHAPSKQEPSPTWIWVRFLINELY